MRFLSTVNFNVGIKDLEMSLALSSVLSNGEPDQKNSGFSENIFIPNYLFNIQKYNHITKIFHSAGFIYVNNLPLLLIFPVVRWYIVFIEYIFSSRFIIN